MSKKKKKRSSPKRNKRKEKQQRANKLKSKRRDSRPIFAPEVLFPVVLVAKEQKKIVHRSFSNCRRAWTTHEKLDQEIDQYYSQDLAAYKRWSEEHIRPLENRQHQLSREIEKDYKLASQIEREAYFSDITLSEAYHRVTQPGYTFNYPQNDSEEEQGPNFSNRDADDFFDEFFEDNECNCDECRAQRKARSTNATGADSDWEDDDDENEDPFAGVQTEADIEEVLQSLFDEMIGWSIPNRGLYNQMFETFCEDWRLSGMYDDVLSRIQTQEVSPEDDAKRIQEIYRCLVKELHPDSVEVQSQTADPHFRAQRVQLWHRTQDAYKARDLNKLTTVKIIYCSLMRKNHAELSCSELDQVRHELKGENTRKRSEIRQLKKGGIWGFSSFPKEKLKNQLRQEKQNFKQQERDMKDTLSEIRRDIARWKRGAEQYTNEAQVSLGITGDLV